MEDELRARVLRALRTWTGVHQDVAAQAAGVAEKTLLTAEKGRGCSDKTWSAMLAYYEAEHRLYWRGGPRGPQVIIAAGTEEDVTSSPA